MPKKSCPCKTPQFKFKVKDTDVGFPPGQDPVPITHACLDVQETFGTAVTIFYGAAVEPTIAFNPKNKNNIVAAWQNDRITNGGALEIGIANTFDGGKSWNQTVVPLQICIGGINQRLSDVWADWSADGKVVYVNFLAINATQVPDTLNQSVIGTSRSLNGGVTWEAPVILVSSQNYLNEPTGQFPFLDKNSITADPNNPSFAYSVWDTFPQAVSFHSDTFFSRTMDHGATWSTAALIYNPFPDLLATGLSNGIENDNQTLGNVIVVLPKKQGGTLLNFLNRIYARPGATDEEYMSDEFPAQFTLTDLVVIRSNDLGNTWTQTATRITPSFVTSPVFTGGYTYDGDGNITGGLGTQLRTYITQFVGDLISPTVNPCNGNLYVVWQSNQLRGDQLSQIALSASKDGGFTWSQPVLVNRTPQNAPNPQAFTPEVAITKDGFVGILYFDFRNDPTPIPNEKSATLTDAWLAIYEEVKGPGETGVGLDFVKEVRLSTTSYIAQNGPSTTQGVMTDGDYCFIRADGKTFFTVYTKSFNGPFTPPTLFFDDPENDAQVFLDNNRRTAPFVSIVTHTN